MVPFVKYTAQGNHFIIIDEMSEERISEEEKPGVVQRMADPCFGIGCDNVLFIQRLSNHLLAELKRNRRYGWLDTVSSWADLGQKGTQLFYFACLRPMAAKPVCAATA